MVDKITFESLFKDKNEQQRKFEYYFLGIIIALLSLSIQTFHPDETTNYIYLMIIMWLFLIVSLLSGFYRLEKMQLFMSYEVDRAYAIQYDGVDKYSSYILSIHEKTSHINNKLRIFYKIQKWSFVMSILMFLLFKILNICK